MRTFAGVLEFAFLGESAHRRRRRVREAAVVGLAISAVSAVGCLLLGGVVVAAVVGPAAVVAVLAVAVGPADIVGPAAAAAVAVLAVAVGPAAGPVLDE